MEKWFYSGTRMPDGAPITVAAHSEVQALEYLKRGLMPIESDKKTRRVKDKSGKRAVKAARTVDKIQ